MSERLLINEPGYFSTDTASLGMERSAGTSASVQKSVGERIFAGRLMGGGTGGGYPGWWSASLRVEQVQHFKFWVQVAISRKMQEAAAHAPNFAVVQRGPAPTTAQHKQLYRQKRYEKSLHAIKPHEEVEHLPWNHPLVTLFAKPNPWDTAGRIWSRLLLYMDLTGNGYLWLVPNRLGKPVQIWVLPSQWVVGPRLHKEGIWYYEVRPLVGGASIKLPPEEVVHFQYDNPLHPLDGWAPTQGGAEWIDVQESVNRRRYWMMKNSVSTQGAVTLDSNFFEPDETDLGRLAAKLFDRYQGEHRDSLPIILPPGAEYTPLKVTPVEMDFIKSHDQMRDATLALFGVPKEVATIQDAGSEIAAWGPMQVFCRFTMGSWFRMVGDVLTKEVARRYYDERHRIWWDDITPDNPEQINADLNVDMANGIRSINEARALRGLEPLNIPEADKPLVNPQLRPLGEKPEPIMGPDGEMGKVPPGSSPEEQDGDEAPADQPQDEEDLLTFGGRLSQNLLGKRQRAVAVANWHAKDRLPGGLGDRTRPEDVDPDELADGIRVEMEHTDDPALAMEIALDHLTENPHYYTHLREVENPKKGGRTRHKAGTFREEEHPRADDGRFGDKPGAHGGGSESGAGKHPAAERENKPPDDAQALATSALQNEIEEYAKLGISPGLANSGDCTTVAREAIHTIREAGGEADYGSPKGNNAHTWVVSGGRHYDIQAPQGVDDPADLPFFQDWPELIEDGWRATAENPDIPRKPEKAHPRRKSLPSEPRLLDLPDIRQDESFDCGMAALASVASYLGVLILVSEPMKAVRTGPTSFTRSEFLTLLCTDEQGTGPEHIAVVAQALGLEVEEREGLTVEDLEAAVYEGNPVICCVQYQGEGWADGHWMVVVGVSPTSVYVQDPTDGLKRIGRRLWERRWRDRSAEGKEYIRYGLVLGLPAEKKTAKIVGE